MKNTQKIILAVIILLAFSYIVVDNKKTDTTSFQNSGDFSVGLNDESMMFAEAEMPMSDTLQMQRSQVFEPTAGKTTAEVDQKIVKTGSITILVDKISNTVQSINNIAEDAEGFTQNSNVGENPNGKKFGYITIRVPADKYNSTLSKIRELGIKTIEESTNAQDVTEQFTDLQTRLKVAQDEERAYLSLLERSGSVGDLLKVQRELSNVRSKIESLKGRIQYLENQTSLSTITVNLKVDASVTIPTKSFRLTSTIRNAFNGAVAIGQGILSAIVWIVILGVLIGAPLALIGWGVNTLWKRTRK